MAGGRSPCCDKSKVKKGPWSPAEDVRLVSFIQKNGHPNWRSLPKQAGLLRCGKSCRLRWINYLRPDLKRGEFTPEDEHLIIQLHSTLGNRWSKIASHFPGRTDNEIKNVWNTHLKKRSLLATNNDIASSKNGTPSSSFASDVSDGFVNQEKTSAVEVTDQPSTPSSTISSNSTQDILANCTWNTPIHHDDEMMMHSFEEYDMEFWNILEPQLISDHEMFEVENWVRSLEMELGLVGPTEAAGQQNEQDDRTMC